MKLRIVLCCALLTAGALAQTLNTAVTGGGTTNYIAKWSSSTSPNDRRYARAHQAEISVSAPVHQVKSCK